jgi:hypothetical protein
VERESCKAFDGMIACLTQLGIARMDPGLGIHGKLINRLEQSVGLRVGHPTGEILFTLVPLHPAAIKIGRQR